MLTRLLKYEFKSVSKILIPLLCAVLVMAVLSAGLLTLNTRFFSADHTPDIVSSLFGIISGVVLAAAILAIIASMLVVLFILLQRYYRSFFGDEGYLTFTLPAKSSEHLMSKLISGFVWSFLSGFCVLFAVGVLVLFGTASGTQIINTDIFRFILELVPEITKVAGTSNIVFFILEYILLAVVGLASQMLLYYLAIAIGSIITRKYKILTSIGVYFGINTVLGIITSILNAVIMVVIMGDTSGSLRAIEGEMELQQTIAPVMSVMHIYFISISLLMAVLGVVSFIICNSLLKKKLNLE